MAQSNRLSSPVDGYHYPSMISRDDDVASTQVQPITSTSNRTSMIQSLDNNDPRSSLQRRFTTNSSANAGGLGPIGSPSRTVPQDSINGQAILDNIKQNVRFNSVNSTSVGNADVSKLLAVKQQELAKIEIQEREFRREMAALEERKQSHQNEMRKLGVEPAPGMYNAGNQSEPTTPPAADSSLYKGSSRTNRFSGSHISNYTAQSRRLRSESKGVTSPQGTSLAVQKPISLTRPGSEVIGSGYAFSPPAPGSRSVNTNRYSLPASALKSATQEIVDVTSTLGLGPTNSASFFTEDTDDETAIADNARAVKARSYVQAHSGDGGFPILIGSRDGVLSASSAAIDKDKTSASTQSKTHSNRHSQVIGAEMKSPRKSGVTGSFQNLASPPKQRNVSDGSDESGKTPATQDQPSVGTAPSTIFDPSPVKNAGQIPGPNMTPLEQQLQYASLLSRAHQGGYLSGMAVNPALLSQMYQNQGQLGMQLPIASHTTQQAQYTHQGNVPQQSVQPSMLPMTTSMMMPNLTNGYPGVGNLGNIAGGQGTLFPTLQTPFGSVPMMPNQFTGGYPLQAQQATAQTSSMRTMSTNRMTRKNNRDTPQPSIEPELLMRLEVTPLYELRGDIHRLAKDQNGCRFLQRKLDERMPESLNIIFDSINTVITDLMIDPFGNYLCQKLLDYCNEMQRTTLIGNATPNMVPVAFNQHGTRALQKMIESVTTSQQVRMIQAALEHNVTAMIQDLNGNHVIQKCLNKFSAPDAQFIFNAVGRDAVLVGTHRHGCCVLQRCVDHANPHQKDVLVSQIINSAHVLVQDPFGNYVLQYVLDLANPKYVHDLCMTLMGEYMPFARQKFASNVIEKLLKVAVEEDRGSIIGELINNPIEFQDLLRDQFGNYVVQTALDVSQEDNLRVLIDCIRPCVSNLRNTPHGRRIASKVISLDPSFEEESGRNSPIDSFSAYGGSNFQSGTSTASTMGLGRSGFSAGSSMRFQSPASNPYEMLSTPAYRDNPWRRHY